MSLAPFVEFYRLDLGTAVLVSDDDCVWVSGAVSADLMEGLARATPIAALARLHGSAHVEQALYALDRRGLLARASPPDAGQAVAAAPCFVGVGPAARVFASALASVAPDGAWDARIVITDSYLRPGLADAGGGRRWLLLKVDRSCVCVSPLFADGRAPCWDCVRTRLLARDDRLARLWYSGHRPLAIDGAAMTFSRELLRAVAAAVDRQLGGAAATGAIVRIAGPDRASMHPVAPLPSCQACEGGRARVARSQSGADLWRSVCARLGTLMDPLCGLVAVQDVHGPVAGNAVAVAVSTYANPAPSVVPVALGPYAAASRFGFGAGVSADDARARAVLEGFERYCTSWHGDELHRRTTRAQLGDAAIPPNDLMCFAADQLSGVGPETPLPYAEDVPLRWRAAATLGGNERWLPLASCYRTPPSDRDAAYCVYDSNGAAVDFTLDDAIVSGFLEVVERDAVAIWWYNRLIRPRVGVESFDDDFFAAAAAAHRGAGRSLTVFDVTTDVAVTTFAALSLEHRGGTPYLGFGAHFDARTALRSALFELGQAICFRAQERRKWAGFDWSGQPHLTATVGAMRQPEDYPAATGKPTPRDCAAAAAAVGAEILVCDCTRADVRLPCVKVVVPGLRGVGPRFGPGRLLDVPVRMGWLAEPTARADLNPEPLRM